MTKDASVTSKNRARLPRKHPKGCKCWNDHSWDIHTPVPPVCRRFERDQEDGVCVRCEHNEECHK